MKKMEKKFRNISQIYFQFNVCKFSSRLNKDFFEGEWQNAKIWHFFNKTYFLVTKYKYILTSIQWIWKVFLKHKKN